MSSKFQSIKKKLKNKNNNNNNRNLTKRLSSVDDDSIAGSDYGYDDDDSSIVSNYSIVSNNSISDHVDMIVSKQTKDMISSKPILTSSEILQQIEAGVPKHLLGYDEEYIRANTENSARPMNDNDKDIHEVMNQVPAFESLNEPEPHDPHNHDESKWDPVIKNRMKAIDLNSILGLSGKKTSNLAEVTQTIMRNSPSGKTRNVEQPIEETKLSLRENWMKKMEEEGLKKAKAEAELIKIKLAAEFKENARIEFERLEKQRIEQEMIDKEREEQEAALKAKQDAYEAERQNIMKIEREKMEKEQHEKELALHEERKKLQQDREEKERKFEEERLVREKKIEEEILSREKEMNDARTEREMKFAEEMRKREKEIEDDRMERDRKYEEHSQSFEKQLEEQRRMQAMKVEEDRLRRESELNERLEREKRLQKELEDERRERERKFEVSRLAMEKQILEQRLLQDKKDEDERRQREKDQEELLEKERRLAKDLEEKQKEADEKLKEMKLAMEKNFDEERAAREKQLHDKLERERQLQEKRVKEEMNLDSLRQRKAKEEADRIERERFEHQKRLEEIESMAKVEARDHINKLANLLSAEKDLLEYEIQKGKKDEALSKEMKVKEMERMKVEEYSKALADEQRKLVAQLQQQSESDDTFQIQVQKHYSKNTTIGDSSSANDSFDDIRIMGVQPLDPAMITSKIEVNDLNMAFTPELNKAMSSSMSTKSLSSSAEKSDAMVFTPDKSTASYIATSSVSSSKSKKGKQEQSENDNKRMKSTSIDDEIATVASFLSTSTRTKDTRSSKEKQVDVDIALKKAALQQKIALQELAEARLEVNIAVMKSQKKLIEKIAKDVFDEKAAKSKPRRFMKASAVLSETIKNNRKKFTPVKKTQTNQRKSRSRRPSYDSVASDGNSDDRSVASSQLNDNSTVMSNDGSGTFLTGGGFDNDDDDDNSSLMSLESMGSLESIDESLGDLGDFGFKPPKKIKWKVIGKYSSHKAAEVAMQMVTQSFDSHPSIDDTRKHGRQKFDLNGDIFDKILHSKKKKSPIKLKHRSARVRFDLNEQLWFVEAPAYKKKKVESNPAASMSSTERVGRTVNTNNNKDRSRSNSLTSLHSSSSRTSKNTATNGKKISSKSNSNNKRKAVVDKQQPNLPDIDSSIDRVQDIRAKEKSLSPLQPRSNSSNNSSNNNSNNSNNNSNSNNSKAKAKAPKTSLSKNKMNALTFPRILAIHQSTNDK